MTDEIPFEIKETGTEKMIIRATYEALIEHGYADLTVKRIGAHFGKTTSLIYQYYDTKDELIVNLLQQLLSQFEGDTIDENKNAHRQLVAAIEPLNQTDPALRDLLTAILELRAQATHNEQFKSEFAKLDAAYINHLRALIELGIQQGIYQQVEPQPVAEHIYASVVGSGFLNSLPSETFNHAASQQELDRYFDVCLLDDDPDVDL